MKGIAQRALMKGGASLLVLSMSCVAGMASAQGRPPVAPEADEASPSVRADAEPQNDGVAQPVAADTLDGGEITVTASRVNRAGYTAATPTIVAGAEQLEARATTNVGQFLNEIPAFKPTVQPTSNGFTQRSAGSNYVDLRGLGTSRTLVLVDGQRFVPEMSAGLAGYQVNLNQIPSLLVDRLEVVTGGASAQWGSDAVAGVVNVLLKERFEGVQAEIQKGVSSYGDNASTRAGALFGKSTRDGFANVTVAVDYEKNDGGGLVSTRDWGRRNFALVVNPCPNQVAVSAACPAGGNGQPVNLILPNAQFSANSPGGVINNTALRGTQFGEGGVSSPFTYGQFVGSTLMAGGGQPGVNFLQDQPLFSGYNRFQAYGRVSLDVADAFQPYLDVNYARSKGGGPTLYRTTSTIRIDNPFLPADIRARMVAANITSFSLGRYNRQIISQGDIRNETKRVVAGVKGRFGADAGWRYAAAVGYGVNDYRQRVYNDGIPGRFAFAADSVLSNGQIVCRATLPGPSFNAAAAGCVPANPFGPNSLTPEAIAYVSGTLASDITYKQTFGSAQVSGEPFQTWAGPVSLAVGGEFRREREVAIADPIANANGYATNNSSSFRGRFSVVEAFTEVVVPLLKDSSLGKSLEVNGAVRYAHYSGASGSQTPWKVGITYYPFEGFLIRAAQSRDIRAPNIFEQQVPASSRSSLIRFGSLQPTVFAISSGNPNLKPEKADTVTAGISYQPPAVPGLAVSVDYYSIKTKDLISTLGLQESADLCLIGKQQSFCDRITYDAAGVPTSIRTPFLNLASVRINGLDGQLSYRLPLATGSLRVAFSGTYVFNSDVNSGALGAASIDRSGENGPRNEFAVARFRFTSSLGYVNGGLSTSIQARHVSGGKYDNTFNATLINDNHVEGRTYFDLSAAYDVDKHFTLFGVVNNLLDSDPPIAPTDNALPTNGIYYDVIGRSFKAGVRLRF